MNPVLNIAKRAAISAGRILLNYFEQFEKLSIFTKEKNEFVTDADIHAEKDIVRILRKTYPNHGIIAEEGSEYRSQDDYQWVIDPLDGTTNFFHGIPHFAISISFRYKDRLEAALVYDPIRGEIFTASRGSGAQLNDKRIRVSNISLLDKALISTGLLLRNPQYHEHLIFISKLFSKCMDIRCAGVTSLDLAYVASGKFDACWALGLKQWDMAAGILLIQEAGGLVSDCLGENNFMQTGNIVAGNPKIFKALLQEIRPHFIKK